MKVFYLNNTGGGFADTIEVAEGTTLGQFFAQKMPGQSAQDYLVRLNRQPASAEEVLTDGARVSITPTKIQGAVAA